MRLTRADLLRCGADALQAGEPLSSSWRFVPTALQALARFPMDHDLRALLCGALLKLGLRTLAEEVLQARAPSFPEQSEADLREMIEHGGVPQDKLDPQSLAETCRANAVALGGLIEGIGPAVERWCAAATSGQVRFYLAADGNVVRREAGASSAWQLVADLRSTADEVASRLLANPTDVSGGIVLEGIDPPWALTSLYEKSTRPPDEFSARLWVLQADLDQFVAGLGLFDVRPMLESGRVRFLVGNGSAAAFRAELWGLFDTHLPSRCVLLPTTRTRLDPAPDQILGQARQEQGAEFVRLQQEVHALYRARGAAWWRARYTSGQGLRVLIPTCRYSTFIQHSSEDIAAGMRAAGWKTRVLKEPDSHSYMAGIAHLRAILEFDPDLVLLINYTRATIGAQGAANSPAAAGLYPEQVPFVCWIQDAMPHLLSRRTGHAQGPLDFVIGHLTPEMFDAFEYPRERALGFPVVVSSRKFHDGATSSADATRFDCELAWVSHHSETPDQMHARKISEARAGTQRALAAVFEDLRPEIDRIMADPVRESVRARLSAATLRALESARVLRSDADAAGSSEAVTQLMSVYSLPMADRILRHRTLEWAVELAARHRWRLRLYGRGWERSDEFGPFAAGELTHGEELRLAYRGARANLHVSVHALAHQRIMECALAGGLALCRWHADEEALIRGGALKRVVRRCDETGEVFAPDASDLARRWQGASVARHPELAEAQEQLRRLGLPTEPFFWFLPARIDSFRRNGFAINDAAASNAMFGDLESCVFLDRTGLERLVRRAVEDPGWRRSTSQRIAQRVRESLTYDAVVQRMTAMVRSSIVEDPGRNNPAGSMA